MTATVIVGDCLDVLRTLPDASVDAVITDPPAGISFMGKVWDSDKGGRDQWIAWLSSVLAEALRVAKPGAHAVVWALPRTSGWTHRALEDAGWEVRDCVCHLFGQGFPKSHNISKALDRAAGVEREVVGMTVHPDGGPRSLVQRATGVHAGGQRLNGVGLPITAPATDLAKQWDGWGTALKPGAEFWYLARKPLAKGAGVAANVAAHGTGALNIDATRIAASSDDSNTRDSSTHRNRCGCGSGYGGGYRPVQKVNPQDVGGRWPSNVVLGHDPDCAEGGCAPSCPVRLLDEQAGDRGKSGDPRKSNGARSQHVGYGRDRPWRHRDQRIESFQGYGDTGGASRFFTVVPGERGGDDVRFRYQSKASRAERNAGLDGMPEIEQGQRYGSVQDARPHTADGYEYPRRAMQNSHPTVKPVALMQWLCRLVTPPGGTILDPFCGSGSTGVAARREGFGFVGIEQDEAYAAIATVRIEGDAPLWSRQAAMEAAS